MQTRVLYLFLSTYLSPPWEVSAQVIRNIDKSRFACFVAADHGAPADLTIGEGAHVERFAFSSSVERAKRGDVVAAAQVARSVAALVALARRERIQIVHTTDDALAMAIAYGVCRACGAQLLVHHHAAPSIYRGARLAFTRTMARVAQCNLGVSRFLAEEIAALGCPRERVTFVLNGIQTARFQPEVDGRHIREEYGVGPDDVLALMISRLWQPKRQIDLVRAMALAVREAPRLKALIVGWDDPHYDGPHASYREELLAACRELGVTDHVIVEKARPHPEFMHAASDFFVMPSLDEPFGLVVGEALAVGRPVVGARSGALPELIDDGVTGFLVPPRSPERLAEKLVELARDPALRQRLGQEARRQAVARLAQERVSQQVSMVYEAMTRGGALPSF